MAHAQPDVTRAAKARSVLAHIGSHDVDPHERN